MAFTVYIRLSATGDNYASNPTGPITIPARPAAPMGLERRHAHHRGGTDGKITGADKNGKPVEVTVKSDGTYAFKQPDGKVKIEVIYKPVQPVETPWNNSFTDAAVDDWYHEAARFVQERSLMNGYSDGRFGPNEPLSRAQAAQMLENFIENQEETT